jgi:2-(1,2-epoxy-1,2-dihydrophenyl)acetyl-CoA isomerase
MSGSRVLLDVQNGIATMTLNHPEALNAFGYKLKQDMSVALDQLDAAIADRSARCLVITGAGRGFSSGANLNDPDKPPRDREAEARGEAQTELESWYNPTLIRLRELSIPTVAAINGVAAGVGMSLALSCDFKVMAKSGFFLQAFARIGLVPDGGSSWILPRLIGMSRAMELSMLAERLPAEKAAEWGMINKAVEDNAVMDEALAFARRLADGPMALGLIRQMYWASLENNYADQMQLESDLQKKAGLSKDNEEGVAAFREKRDAKFIGA